MNSGSQAPTPGDPAQSRHEDEAGPRPLRLELPDAARELLSIVGFVAADDGPLRSTPGPGTLSPWHQEALQTALERLEVIDHYLRGRVAFFVAGKDHGYGPFEGELELARRALDTCRVVARVVDALLAGRPPTDRDLDTMPETAVRLQPALEALEDSRS
jgi:hypothetical protein